MRGPGWSSVVLLAVGISLTVSLAVQWAGDTGRLDMLWQGRQVEVDRTPENEPDTRPVPQLIGLPRKIAGELLKSRDLMMVVREERHDPDIHQGGVLSQDPLPGSDMPPGGQVSVVLSKGAGVQETAVPTLAGATLQAAREQLAALSLEVGELSGPEGDDSRLVVESAPAAGETVEEGTAVSLTVGLPPVQVPKLVGMSMRKAETALEEAGLEVGKVRRRFNDLRPGWAILSQSPEPGEEVPAGSAVDIVRNQP